MRNIIFDIDGTLSDPSHRLHYLADKDWDSFYNNCDKDPVVSHIAYLVQELAKEHKIYIFTGRPEKVRSKTEKWLLDNLVPYDKLIMRKDGDYRPDHEVKAEMLESLNLPIWFAVDDRDQVVHMYREKGILCLQCKDGAY